MSNIGHSFRQAMFPTSWNDIRDLAVPGAALLSQNAIYNPFNALLNALIPTPKVPAAIAAGSQVYNVASRQNLARLQDPQPILYGRFRVYPDLMSTPWAEYIGNDQYFYQLMEVTQGIAELDQLFIGETPIESFAAIEYKIYKPGELVDMFHNNVFTNAQVVDLELVTIGLISPQSHITFRSSPHTISCPDDPPLFADFKEGDLIRVANSLLNNGDYTIATVAPDFKSVVITGVLNDESFPTLSTITGPGPTVYGPKPFDFGNIPILGSLVSDSSSTVDMSALNPGDTITISGSKRNDGSKVIYSGGTVGVRVTTPWAANESHDQMATVQLIGNQVGPFFANPKGTNISQFQVDITFPRGLYTANDDGSLGDKSATLKIEYRQEGDAHYTLAEDATFTAASNTPQRYTKTYVVGGSPFTGRLEVKVTRTSATADDGNNQDESHWNGLRGFINAPTEVSPADDKPIFETDAHWRYPDVTVLAVKARATGQLSSAMSQSINGIFQRLLRTWTGSYWTDPRATSSIAWIYADAITNTAYGLGRPDDELDLDGLLAFDNAATERGDFFNGYFDQQGTEWDALTNIARVGRAAPIHNADSIFSLVRDEPRALRAGLFSDRNRLKNSLSVNFDMVGEETPQGVRVTYSDPVTFQLKTILCGVDVNATDITLMGCTDRQQAWNEGNFVLNGVQYRRINVSFGTERDGFVPVYMDLAEVQATFPNWGQSARVISVAGNVLTLDCEPDWSAPPYTVRMRRPDGTPTDPLPGTGSGDTFTLDDPPPFAVQTDGEMENTHVAIGNDVSSPLDILIKAVEPQDEHHVNLMAVVDDPRVYANPGPAPPEDQ